MRGLGWDVSEIAADTGPLLNQSGLQLFMTFPRLRARTSEMFPPLTLGGLPSAPSYSHLPFPVLLGRQREQTPFFPGVMSNTGVHCRMTFFLFAL